MMGLLMGLLTLPVAPVRGTIALAEQIHRQAEKEFYDPSTIRRQLEDIDRQRSTGELTDEEADAFEEELIERLLISQTRTDLWEG